MNGSSRLGVFLAIFLLIGTFALMGLGIAQAQSLSLNLYQEAVEFPTGDELPAQIQEQPQPLPEECDDITPLASACCGFGYAYLADVPVMGAIVHIQSPEWITGVYTITKNTLDTHPYPHYVVDLGSPPLSVWPGQVITITISYSDMVSIRTWTVQTKGQQIDLGLVAGYQGTEPMSSRIGTADRVALTGTQVQDPIPVSSGACYAQLDSNPVITYTTVQAAVDAAGDGDTVKVAGYCSGVETRSGLTQTVYISKSLTLRGGYTTTNWTQPDPEAQPTTLDAQGQGRVVYITGDNNVTIENLQITGGDVQGRGGGLYKEEATLTLNNTVVISNSAGVDGGGLCLFSGSTTMYGGRIANNTAPNPDDADGGGLYIAFGSVTLDGVQIDGNSANIGGGVLFRSTATLLQIDGGSVLSNTARNKGGGLYVAGNSVTLNNTSILSNNAEYSGGGILVASPGVTLNGVQIVGNSAANGGGVQTRYGSSLMLKGSSVLSNTAGGAGGDGGGLCLMGGSVTLDGGQIAGNVGIFGGGVYIGSQSTFTQTADSLITHNQAQIEGEDGGRGGGLYVDGGRAMLGEGQVIDNAAPTGYGGGVYVAGSGATLSGGRIRDNVAVWGGGVEVRQATAALNGTQVLSNAAYKDGGGLHLEDSTVTLTNTVVAGNQADLWPGVWLGSGLYVLNSSLDSRHATIALNSGGDGSGIHVAGAGSTVALTNTILISHTRGITIGAENTATLEATLWGNDTDWSGNGTIVTGTHNYWGDPAFADPATGDYHILLGSAAIGRGEYAGVLEDIDGDPRDEDCDIGADEFALVAEFTASPLSSPAPAIITFTDQSRGRLVAWTWAFGDSRVSGARHPTHTYEDADVYSVSLTVAGPDGSNNQLKEGYITTGLPPTATLDSIGPNPATQGQDTITFQGTGQDQDEDQAFITTYDWRSSLDGWLSDLEDFAVPAAELSAGTHTIFFRVQDDETMWSEEVSQTLTVLPGTARTLVLVNGQKLEDTYSAVSATLVLSALNQLANHDKVGGLVMQVEEDPAVAAAYAAWDADPTNAAKANVVTAAIKDLVDAHWTAYPDLGYLVIVGDDRIVPFRRVLDQTDYPEGNYGHVSCGSVTGAALCADMTLTDDYYTDATPTVPNSPGWDGHDLYIPDLATGRLVETPAEIVAQIDAFLTNDSIAATSAIVTGYDFVKDGAKAMRNELVGDGFTTDSSLIGGGWGPTDLKNLVLDTRHEMVSINGHANHFTIGTPSGPVYSDQVLDAEADHSGVILYTVGCHSGLNVAPDNAQALDLTQALIEHQANYVANTGYGWGYLTSIGLSEQLMLDLTERLVYGQSATVGQALVAAKQEYYLHEGDFDFYDEKILIESTLYGLPMYRYHTPGVVGQGSESPDQEPIVVEERRTVVLSNGLTKNEHSYQFSAFPLEITPSGKYYSFGGQVHSDHGKPILPKHVVDVSFPQTTAQGAVFRGGIYTDIVGFDPVVELAVTQTVTLEEPTFDAPNWYPAQMLHLNRLNQGDYLALWLGQYNPHRQTERVYEQLSFDVYYHQDPDEWPVPEITGLDFGLEAGTVTVTVQASNPMSVETVVVAYTDGQGTWDSVDLVESGGTWSGSFPGSRNTEFFVQVVDRAGNVAVDDNGGRYYQLLLCATDVSTYPLDIALTIQDTFGPRLLKPYGYSRYDFHRGMDWPAATGTPVYAATEGIVRSARNTWPDGDIGSGKFVHLQHKDIGCETRYNHLSEVYVAPGDTVTVGQIIGAVGDTGAMYSHLHFEVRQGLTVTQRAAIHPLGTPFLPRLDPVSPTVTLLGAYTDTTGLTALVEATSTYTDPDVTAVGVTVSDTVTDSRIIDYVDLNTNMTVVADLDDPLVNDVCIIPADLNETNGYLVTMAFHKLQGGPAATVTAWTTDVDGWSSTDTVTLSKGLEVLPPEQTAHGVPSQTVTFVYTLTNYTGASNTFSLTHLSAQGWPAAVSPPTATLASGESVTVSVRITVNTDQAGPSDCGLLIAEPSNQSQQIAAGRFRIVRDTYVSTQTGSDVAGCGSMTLPCQSIGYAIEQTDAGGTIHVAEGTYIENLTLTKTVDLLAGYSLDWTARYIRAYSTTVDGGGNGAVLVIDGDYGPLVEGFTFVNGYRDGAGGGVRLIGGAAPTLRFNWILSNTAELSGGGIYVGPYGSLAPTIISNTIAENRSNTSYGGGIYVRDRPALIQDNDIVNNRTLSKSGGGLYLTGSTTAQVINNEIVSNTAASGGGGVYIFGQAAPTLRSNQIVSNTATSSGGGIYVGGSGTLTPTIISNTIAGNVADGSFGGGIYVTDHPILIQNNDILNNEAVVGGGGLYLTNDTVAQVLYNQITGNWTRDWVAGAGGGGGGAKVAESDVVFVDNVIDSNTTPKDGGGLFIVDGSTATLSGNAFVSNMSPDDGGGLRISDSSATLTENVLTSNQAGDAGGGLVLSGGTFMLSGNSVISNTANDGGGLRVSVSNVTFSGNTITANTANEDGGGLYLLTSEATFQGNSFADNLALDRGGGLFLYQSTATSDADLVVTNSSRTSGGGLYLLETGITLTNTIIADNQATDHGSGLYISGSSPHLVHTTIARNGSVGGSGVYVTDQSGIYSTMALSNTILVSHTTGITCTPGNTITLECTLWYSNATDIGGGCAITSHNDHTGDPAFVPDGYHLGPGSVAIDICEDEDVDIDIDRQSRPIGLGYDAGVDEFSGVSFMPNYWSTAGPGQVITYSHTLANYNTIPDTFDITHTSSQGWLVDYWTPISLEAGEATTLVVSVTIPAGALSGTVDLTTLTATSQTSPTLFAATTDSTTIIQVADVLFVPDHARHADPGQVVVYTHTLTNTGNGPDAFQLTHFSSQNWAVGYDTPLALETGQSLSLTVRITVPADALSSTVDTTFITATSQADPSVSVAITDATTARQVPSLILSSDQASDADPGEMITYTHILTNTGNGTDTFSLSAVSSQGWSITHSPDPTLTSGAFTTIYVTLTVPAGTAAGTVDETTLTAVSQADGSVSATVTDTTTVSQVAGVSLSPDQEDDADPGETVVYTHVLTNTGNGPDVIHITHASSQGWAVVYSSPVSLDAGQEATLVVSISVPPDVLSGTVDTTLITATSQVSPVVSDFVVDTTRVNPIVDFYPDRDGVAIPAQTVVYSHTLENLGNGPDTFDLTYHSSQDWIVTYNTPIPLGPGQMQTVMVSITIPLEAISGTLDTTVLTATSRANAMMRESVTDTTRVQQLAGVELSPTGIVSSTPGTVVTYTHILTNTGNYTDTFDLIHGSSQGWMTYLSPVGPISLAARQRMVLSLSVSVPEDAVNGTEDQITLTAISQADERAFATITDITIVESPGFYLYLPLILRRSD